MRFLLDTQLVYWWLAEERRIPAVARGLIENSTDAVMVSIASEWELAIKTSMGRMHIDLPVFSKAIDDAGFERLPITPPHLHALVQLPHFDDHKDPFDRLLVAQSLSEPLILLTTDAKLARYGTTVRVV